MSTTATEAKFLTLPEVADRYRTTAATIRYWRSSGYGPKAVKVGRRVLFPLSELEAFDQRLLSDAAA
ncbi:helix-turn-helix domain-containing protein [Amycolatopsis sp. FBCC-B4732]|uniref:helix-turn-helix transcriptional regulator n=1 Tax=Amycolatopsis sp. FBCC-B4732 TaxID=3079339 RepID=UPI001FF38BAF|nr:helix-turn-helix domain-containing protein [Amycolatopsis sp. FBCC-B4732]UOX85318.1 helix-turn-helix domain-containing protein [Amycolatopsis sp. FBCC-B4732]